MFPNVLSLILSLPLLLLAYPPIPPSNIFPLTALTPRSIKKPPPPNPPITAPTGDTLNRTACFCASPQWIIDQNYGFVYLLTYHNAHQNRTYTLKPACRSLLSVNVIDKYDPKNKPVLQNECLRSRVEDPMMYCTGKQGHKDVFCYRMAGGAELDSYWFGGQHRDGLPGKPVVNYTMDVVERVCEAACKAYVEGMEMLKDDALEVLEGYYDLVGQTLKSSVVFYPSIPDMCDGCK